jgi:YesN/AraC family two-component response regulator
MSATSEKDLLKQDRINKLKGLNDDAVNYRYLVEDQATDAITEGDQSLLADTLQIIELEKVLDYLKQDGVAYLLRNFKNHLIIVNTYCRIAAKNGGVLPLYLHLISERFSMLIEDADSVEFLREHVYHEIYQEYCQAVSEFSTTEYSPVMTEIVRYITENLTDNLTLTMIAEKFDMHPVHLARKFKQETGTTFISYVNVQRVYLAKYYFHLGRYQLSEVATLSGFNSHSYFTKVFKKTTGQTPTRYLKQLPLKEKV